MEIKMIDSQWQGKKVAFLGDSITDPVHIGTEKNYWQFLEEQLGITPVVYALSGARWQSTKAYAEQLFNDHGSDVDAIFIFMGTNDYMGAVPPGEWFYEKVEEKPYYYSKAYLEYPIDKISQAV